MRGVKKEPDLIEGSGSQSVWLVQVARTLYIPFEHFFAVASHFMPAFSQAA